METAFDIKISFSQDWYFPPDYKRKAQQDRKNPKPPNNNNNKILFGLKFL